MDSIDIFDEKIIDLIRNKDISTLQYIIEDDHFFHDNYKGKQWSTKSNHAVRNAIGLKDRKITNLYFGSFGFTKKTIKIEPKSTARPGRLSFLPKFFGKEHEGIKLSRCTKPIPPLDHDVHFELRKDHKWVIHIPCDFQIY